jgi:hypothetical protein
MTYEQYLFSQLLALFNFDFAEQPYEYQYEDALKMYAEFEQSPFNVGTRGVYECIVNFLRNKYGLSAYRQLIQLKP